MESTRESPDSREKAGAHHNEHLSSTAAVYVRLWEYRGPQEKLQDLDWTADDAIADLIRLVVREGQGRISGLRGSTLIAQFDNSFNALSAAKSLQVRLLTFQRNPPAAQIVAAALVHGRSGQSASPTNNLPSRDSMLQKSNSAQILVSEGIYESAKTVPGFQFNAKRVRTLTQGSEALYELLWTDESTYSHVRKTGQNEDAATSTANRYEIVSELGRGAMGIVYKAHDQIIGRTVALKTISIQQSFGDGAELVERLKLEAKAAGGLDHPNIITIYDIGQQEDFVYLSMQFVEGQTLAALLDGGKLPSLSTLLSYADQMCSAVGFAHQRGVIHRDLKPANFMLTSEDTIKVLDFGIAKLGDTTMTQTGVVVGTPTYMAPEQATGKKLDHRSDIFALGTVFYELFTREKPFKGEMAAVLYKLVHEDPTPPSLINPSLPNGVDAIIRKALAKNPADRYQSCEEMRDALREQAALLKPAPEAQSPVSKANESGVVQSRPISSTRIPRLETPVRSSSRSAWIGIAAAVLITTLGGAGWALHVKSKTGAFPPRVEKALAAVLPQPTMTLAGPVAIVVENREPAMEASTSESITVPENGTPVPQTSAAAESGSTSAAASTPATDGASTEPIVNDSANSVAVTTTSLRVTAGPSDNSQSKSAAERAAGSSSPAQLSKASSENEKAPASESEDSNSRSSARHAPVRPADENRMVEGFSRSDIPDLLRRADAAAGAGDYRLARYEYSIVLRLDHRNAAARNGLARVLAAREERLNTTPR